MGLKVFYWIMIALILIGVLNPENDYFTKSFLVILICLLIILVSPKIIMEKDRITEKSLFQSRSTLFSEIQSMKLKINPLYTLHLKFIKYYLEIKKKDNNKAKTFRIYSYDNSEKIMDILEKGTGKKIENRKNRVLF